MMDKLAFQLFRLGMIYQCIEGVWEAYVWEDLCVSRGDGRLVIGPRSNRVDGVYAMQRFRHDQLQMQLGIRIGQSLAADADEVGPNSGSWRRIDLNSEGCPFERAELDGGIPTGLCMQIAADQVFWGVLLDEPLSAQGVTCRLLLRAWGVVASIAQSILEGLEEKEGGFSLRDFSPLIDLPGLERFMSDELSISSSAGREIVSMFLYPGGGKDAWFYPLVRCGSRKCVLHLPVALTSNLSRCVHRWLLDAEVDIGKRGDGFEADVRSRLGLLRPCFEIATTWAVCPGSLHVSDGVGASEQVDLLFRCGDSVFVVEVKCFVFPSEPEERYRLRGKLRDAAAQALRKARFVSACLGQVEDLTGWRNLDASKFVPIVLCSEPIGSGFPVDGVSIVDFHELQIAVETGRIRFLYDPRAGRAHYDVEVFPGNQDVGDEMRRHLERPGQGILESFLDMTESPLPLLGDDYRPAFYRRLRVDLRPLENAIRSSGLEDGSAAEIIKRIVDERAMERGIS